ncbi:hypothetical protein BZA70DRAFT_25406 [Myxozyma melibiosi]|uniref:Uncharacterized protein n=1 Tax=Myxozyma melibiosi TaxID=54550 RepID=A0ABR1FD64_9ASCO
MSGVPDLTFYHDLQRPRDGPAGNKGSKAHAKPTTLADRTTAKKDAKEKKSIRKARPKSSSKTSSPGSRVKSPTRGGSSSDLDASNQSATAVPNPDYVQDNASRAISADRTSNIMPNEDMKPIDCVKSEEGRHGNFGLAAISRLLVPEHSRVVRQTLPRMYPMSNTLQLPVYKRSRIPVPSDAYARASPSSTERVSEPSFELCFLRRHTVHLLQQTSDKESEKKINNFDVFRKLQQDRTGSKDMSSSEEASDADVSSESTIQADELSFVSIPKDRLLRPQDDVSDSYSKIMLSPETQNDTSVKDELDRDIEPDNLECLFPGCGKQERHYLRKFVLSDEAFQFLKENNIHEGYLYYQEQYRNQFKTPEELAAESRAAKKSSVSYSVLVSNCLVPRPLTLQLTSVSLLI